MIEIQNSEHYYSLPGAQPNKQQQHLPQNMIYKAMIYLTQTFTQDEVRTVLKKLWGIEINNQKASVGLRVLRELGYVTRGKPGKGIYLYRKTPKYDQELMQRLR